TTAPMTWVTRPIWLAAVAINYLITIRFRVRSDCFRAGYDFDKFLGDHRLTRTVVDQGLLADHFAGVARGVVHRAHLRAVERGVVFQQRAEDLHRQILRQQLGEDVCFLGLVFVGGGRRRGAL